MWQGPHAPQQSLEPGPNNKDKSRGAPCVPVALCGTHSRVHCLRLVHPIYRINLSTVVFEMKTSHPSGKRLKQEGKLKLASASPRDDRSTRSLPARVTKARTHSEDKCQDKRVGHKSLRAEQVPGRSRSQQAELSARVLDHLRHLEKTLQPAGLPSVLQAPSLCGLSATLRWACDVAVSESLLLLLITPHPYFL